MERVAESAVSAVVPSGSVGGEYVSEFLTRGSNSEGFELHPRQLSCTAQYL